MSQQWQTTADNQCSHNGASYRSEAILSKVCLWQINFNARGLAAMGLNSVHYGSLLISIILSKIASEMHLHITKETKKDVWEIRELLDRIK